MFHHFFGFYTNASFSFFTNTSGFGKYSFLQVWVLSYFVNFEKIQFKRMLVLILDWTSFWDWISTGCMEWLNKLILLPFNILPEKLAYMYPQHNERCVLTFHIAPQINHFSLWPGSRCKWLIAKISFNIKPIEAGGFHQPRASFHASSFNYSSHSVSLAIKTISFSSLNVLMFPGTRGRVPAKHGGWSLHIHGENHGAQHGSQGNHISQSMLQE